MSPLLLAAVWVGGGVLGSALPRAVHRQRAALVGPLAAGGLAALLSVSASPGPWSSDRYGASLALDRTSAGLLVAFGVTCALALALAPSVEGGEALAMGLAGAAAVVALGATVPLVWSLALAVGAGTVAIRWIAVAPERSTLSTGRTAGLGAACLLAGAAVVPVAGHPSDVRVLLSGGLLAAGASALVALLPVGGWAAAAASAVRGTDLAAWGLVLAPAVLVSTAAGLGSLPDRARTTVAGTLLVLGLASAVHGAALAVRTPGAARYGRLLLADLGMAAAGLGSRQEMGRLGMLAILLAHLAAAPLLLHAPRPGLQRPHRLAWLALSGLPLSAVFWGRFLVLQGLAATSSVALAAGLLASAGLLMAAMRGLVHGEEATEGRRASAPLRGLGWLVAVAALGIGIAPAWSAARVFGVDLGG